MPQSKEERKAYEIQYRIDNREKILAQQKTGNGYKSMKIGSWKRQGIIPPNDWDKFFETVMSIKNCEMCGKELTRDRYNTDSTRTVDHDHNIKHEPNVRSICCHPCNCKARGLVKNNTSGTPNISLVKKTNKWRFKKVINGVPFVKYGFDTIEDAIKFRDDYLTSV